MMASLDLVTMNRRNTPTFRRAGTHGYIIDLTVATQRIAEVISNWSVREDYTASDHQYICYEVHSLQEKPSTVSDCGTRLTG